MNEQDYNEKQGEEEENSSATPIPQGDANADAQDQTPQSKISPGEQE